MFNLKIPKIDLDSDVIQNSQDTLSGLIDANPD